MSWPIQKINSPEIEETEEYFFFHFNIQFLQYFY